MALPVVGSYTITVIAHAVSPSDYDETNNVVIGVAQIVDGDPDLPPANGGSSGGGTGNGGSGFGAGAHDNQFCNGSTGSPNNGTLFCTSFLGDSAQTAEINDLSSTIIASGGVSGTFTLAVHLYTVDSVADQALIAKRDLGNVTWTGDLAMLFAATQLAAGAQNCVKLSTVTGVTSTIVYQKNGNTLSPSVCMKPNSADATKLDIGVNLTWDPPPCPGTTDQNCFIPAAAADGAAQFGSYLFWDTDLKFSALANHPVSHAPVSLGASSHALAGPNRFNAVQIIQRGT